MQFPYYTQWEAVSYVQTIIFFLLLAVNIGLVVAYIGKPNTRKLARVFGIYFSIFCCLKIIGGITGLVTIHAKNFNQSSYTAAYICDSVALGLLMRTAFSFLEIMERKDRDEEVQNQEWKLEEAPYTVQPETPARSKYHPFQLLTILILASMVCAIAGTSMITSATDFDSPSGTTLLKVSSFLFLASTLVLGALLAWVFVAVRHFRLIILFMFAYVILLVVRCSYSILSAMHGVNFNKPSAYIILFGDYKYYTFLAFLPESLNGIILLVVFGWFLREGLGTF